MDIKHAIFSLDGRINRKTFWISILILSAVMIAYSTVVNLILVPEPDVQGESIDELKTYMNEIQKQLAYPTLVMVALIAYPYLAIAGKRFHDRNKSMWFYVPGLVSMFLDPLLVVTGYAGTMFEPSNLRIAGYVFMGIVSLWYLIELGMLRGTEGPNKYGEDTLPPRQQSTSA